MPMGGRTSCSWRATDWPEASIQLFPCLSTLTCSKLDDAVHATLIASGLRALVAALDDRSNARLPWWPWCESLTLYGFEDPGHLTLYHYWYDELNHDGRTAADWYRRNSSEGVIMHNFRREHDFMRGELGVNASSVGPFVVRRRVIRQVCRTDDPVPEMPARAGAPNRRRPTARRARPQMRRNLTGVRMEEQSRPLLTRLWSRAVQSTSLSKRTREH